MLEEMSCTRVSRLSRSMKGRNRSRCSPPSYRPSGALWGQKHWAYRLWFFPPSCVYIQVLLQRVHLAPPL